MYRPACLALCAALLLPIAPPASADTPPGDTAAETTTRAAFGAALLFDGDHLIAGRSGYSARFPAPPSQSGGVYVYAPEGEGYALAQTLLPDDAAVGDAFGSALALGGGLLAVGAPAARGCGAVYVYEKLGAEWTEMQRIAPANCADGARFGAALAFQGEALHVGAPGLGEGAVFSHTAKGERLRATNERRGEARGDGFGSALAADGEMLLVGAPGVDEGVGRAYVFAGEARTPSHTLAARGDGTSALRFFGLRVALHGGTALVAAPGIDAAGNTFGVRPTDGAVFAYEARGWKQTALLEPSGEGREARGFGTALALTSDGLAWVGAPYAGGGRGTVRSYHTDGFAPAHTLSDGSLSQSDNLGSVMAAAEGRVASAALRAAFGDGRVIVFHRSTSSADAEDPWRIADGFTETGRDLRAITGEEVRCSVPEGDGTAGEFGCQRIDLLSFLPTGDIGGDTGVIVNDIWGWTDPETGREIVIQGRSNGTSFIDITDPAHPVYLADVPMTPGSAANAWRDVKVFKGHALIVADNVGPHGMQIVDLARLRPLYTDASLRPATLEPDVVYREINSAHNVIVNEATDFAYLVGSSAGGTTCGGALHMVDLSDLADPTFAGCHHDTDSPVAGNGATHDAQCVVYDGPDSEYAGREICLSSNGTALNIADVTDKDAPKTLAYVTFPHVAYAHQGWLTMDQRYFYMNDEADEMNTEFPGTRTLVWDVADLDDPILVKEFYGTNGASDHNLYLRGDLMYQANYIGGLRIIDVKDPLNPREVGYFDTVPWSENVPGFAGAWSVYPYFESGTIVVSSINEGVFMLRYNPPEAQ